MPNYKLKEIEAVQGIQKFYKLEIDGVCEFDKFWEEMEEEGKYSSELDTMLALMDYIAKGNSLPKEKFRELKGRPSSDLIKEYEIKTKHLRVYMFHDSGTGKIIVCGGKKGKQEKDIKKLRKTKNKYLDQK